MARFAANPDLEFLLRFDFGLLELLFTAIWFPVLSFLATFCSSGTFISDGLRGRFRGDCAGGGGTGSPFRLSP